MLGLGVVCHRQGVRREQFQEGITGVGFGPLGERQQALFELREAGLRLPRRFDPDRGPVALQKLVETEVARIGPLINSTAVIAK